MRILAASAGRERPAGGRFQALGVRLPGPFGVEIEAQVPVGTSLKALP